MWAGALHNAGLLNGFGGKEWAGWRTLAIARISANNIATEGGTLSIVLRKALLKILMKDLGCTQTLRKKYGLTGSIVTRLVSTLRICAPTTRRKLRLRARGRTTIVDTSLYELVSCFWCLPAACRA